MDRAGPGRSQRGGACGRIFSSPAPSSGSEPSPSRLPAFSSLLTSPSSPYPCPNCKRSLSSPPTMMGLRTGKELAAGSLESWGRLEPSGLQVFKSSRLGGWRKEDPGWGKGCGAGQGWLLGRRELRGGSLGLEDVPGAGGGLQLVCGTPHFSEPPQPRPSSWSLGHPPCSAPPPPSCAGRGVETRV